MKFLADENFPYSSYLLIKEFGIDIQHVTNIQSGLSDIEVIDKAKKDNRIIITFDSDFGELIVRSDYQAMGVIYFRWTDFAPETPGKFVIDLIEYKRLELKHHITVISNDKIRQRKL